MDGVSIKGLDEARPGFGYCEEHRAASVKRAIEQGKKATAKAKKVNGANERAPKVRRSRPNYKA